MLVFDGFHSITGNILSVKRPEQGCNFDVTLLHAANGKFIVKTGDADWKITELEKEAAVLTTLAAYQPLVPCFLAREEDHFLFTYLEGENLVAILQKPETDDRLREKLLYEYGQLLATIHTWRPILPYPADWLGEAVRRAESNVCTGQVSGVADEFSSHSGRPVEDLLAYVQSEKHLYSCCTPVFCHGDWCLPNIIAENGSVSGAIDWSNGGYKDYRYDIATALWTLARNRHSHYAKTFIAGYENDIGWEEYNRLDEEEDGERYYHYHPGIRTHECAFFEALYALI